MVQGKIRPGIVDKRKFRHRNLVLCFWCTKLFERTPSKVKDKNFCSPECSNVARKFLSMRFDTCRQCGNMFEYDAVENAYGRKFCTKECHEVYNRGEHNHLYGKRSVDHPSFREVKKDTPYGYVANFHEIAKCVKKRDGYTCMKCGVQHENLHTHHIDHDKKNNTCHNLITLCVSCHAKETTSSGNERLMWIVELSALAGGMKEITCGNQAKHCKLASKREGRN